MISECISYDIPPQMKILNMVIPILMHYYHFPFKKREKMFFVVPSASVYQLHIFTYQPLEAMVCNDVRFATGYTDQCVVSLSNILYLLIKTGSSQVMVTTRLKSFDWDIY